MVKSMLRIILFLVGFGLSIIGFVYIIAYLNYLSIGYSFTNYLKFIMTRIECLVAVVGIVFINIAIFMKGNKNELRI